MQLDRLGTPEKHCYGNTSKKFYLLIGRYSMEECSTALNKRQVSLGTDDIRSDSLDHPILSFVLGWSPRVCFTTRRISKIPCSGVRTNEREAIRLRNVVSCARLL